MVDELEMTVPGRSLFIVSIGNLAAPYTLSRHSAGHTLLKAIEPLLLERVGLAHSSYQYKTWQCPSLMNVSGPALTRRLKPWLAEQRRIYRETVTDAQSTTSTPPPLFPNRPGGDQEVGLDVRGPSQQLSATLVILHDELEAELGQLKVRRGGPEQASLRGHRGLKSVMESLRGAGLLQQQQRLKPARSKSKSKSAPNETDARSELEILRVGIGIGRPESRNKDDVSRYVLADMSPRELQVIRRAASPVVDTLVKELKGKRKRQA